MKKVLALFLAAILMISLTACGETIEKPAEQTETSTTSEGETTVVAGSTQITIGESMQYTSLDPAHEYEGDAEMALHAAYDCLVLTPPEDESDIQPAVAESWTISEDGLTYVFTLTQGILFTTGKELNAEDAAYCLTRVKGVKGNPSFLLDTVDTIEATGDYELTLTLNTPNPSLLSILTRATFGIYDSDVAKANGGTCDENDTFSAYVDANPSIGSGPYQITAYNSGSEVILEKYADSVLRTGKVDKYVIVNMADVSAQQMAIEAGDIDFALDLTADQTSLLTDNEDIQLISSKTDDIFFLMLNDNAEYGKELADEKVREAITYAIDYTGLCQLAGNGAFTPASIIPKGFTGYLGESQITRDVEKAKALLTEAGYPDGFSFHCGVIPDMAPDGVSFMMIAEKVQSDLAEVGIDMIIDSQEVSVYLEGYRNGTQQAVVSQWGPDYYDSNNQLAFLPGNTVGLRAGWTADADPDLVALGQQAAVETDDATRVELFEAIQNEMIACNSPFIVVLQPGRTWAVNARVQNVVPSTAYYLEFADLEVK